MIDRTEGYNAFIRDTANGWARNTVHVLVGRPYSNGGFELVNNDGTATAYEAGAAIPEGAGWEIPRGAVYALAEAIQRWQGDANQAATEVRVLREVLDHERMRVDSILSSGRDSR